MYSRESLRSFRQASHIEIIPTVETRRVPAGISISALHTEYPVGHESKLANNWTVSRAKVTEGKSASTQSAILPHRMSVPQVHYPSTCTAKGNFWKCFGDSVDDTRTYLKIGRFCSAAKNSRPRVGWALTLTDSGKDSLTAKE